MRFLIVCSSSGGHVYPGWNFGDYLRKCGEEIKFLGIKGEIEEKIIKKEDLITLDAPKSFKKSLKHLKTTIASLKQINRIVDDYDVIIGFGGFITFLVSMCPNVKKKKFYLHEANVDLGDSNRMSLRKARLLFTAYKDLNYKGSKKVFVGNPVVDSLKIDYSKKKKISFIFGSLGSKTLLEKVSEFLLHQKENEKFIVVTSHKFFDEYHKKLQNISNVKVIKYIDRNELYSISKLIFCRGGASTLSEVMNSKTNCVCIPSPYVKHNHQYNNAKYFFYHHALTLIKEEDFNSDKIKECLEYYKTEFAKMEIKNQKLFATENVSMKMYLKIKYDHNLQKL